MLFGSKKVIGLDIGTSSIKIAEVDVSKSNVHLSSFTIIATPPGAVGLSGDLNDTAGLGAIIKQALSSNKIGRKSVSTGLWGTGVVVKKAIMPRMDKKLLKEQVPFEAPQYIPFDISTISLDYSALDLPSVDGNMEVLLVAAQNTLISQYESVIEYCGLKCSVMDVTGFALANLYEVNYGKNLGEVIGIFNFGSSVTNFVAIQNGEVIFCRDIPVGGQAYTNEIHKGLLLSLEEAEALKLSAVAKREVPNEVFGVISSTNEVVAEEVRNSLEYLTATSNVTLSRCFFTGGSSVIPGLIETLANSTGITFEPFDPFSRISVDGKRFPPQVIDEIRNFAAIAIGLGLRSEGDSE